MILFDGAIIEAFKPWYAGGQIGKPCLNNDENVME